MTSRFPPSPYNEQNIARWLEDMNFMFSWQEQYFTRLLGSLVRYCSCHSNIKFISSRHRVISSMYVLVCIRMLLVERSLTLNDIMQCFNCLDVSLVSTHNHLFVFCQILCRSTPKIANKKLRQGLFRALVTPALPEKNIILSNYMETRLNWGKQNGGLLVINFISAKEMDDLENNAEDLPDGN